MRYSAFLLSVLCLLGGICGEALGAPGNISDQKEYLQRTLNYICGAGGCAERPNPYIPGGAEDIISGGMILAAYDNEKKLAEFNQPLRSMGIENTLIIPAGLVDNAICKYYGFTVSKYDELQKAAERKQFTYQYFALSQGDAGLVDFKIDNMSVLKNGLLRVTGLDEAEEPAPFKAYFKKANCGGKEHWVLLKVVYNTPEEDDDFTAPKDE